MPKLPQATQQAAAEAESRDFSAFSPGIYPLQLTAVDVTKKGKDSGEPYWEWEFTVTSEAPAGARGRKLWMNTSLSESSAWKVREVYDALGFTLESDTDEMIGDLCRGQVGTEIQAKGARAGQTVNTLDKLLPLHENAAPANGQAAAKVSAQATASDDPWS